MRADELLPKYGTPSILRKDLDWGRRGRRSLNSRPSSPLKYFSMKERSLETTTVLVVIMIPFHDSQMQSMFMLDLYDLRRLLIWLTWALVLLRILPLSDVSIGIRMFFLEGPLVVICNLGLLGFNPSPTLFISMIFFTERIRKASWSLRRSSGLPLAACAKDLLASLDLPRSLSLFFSSRAFLRTSRESRRGIGGGSLDTLAWAEPSLGLGACGA